MLPELQKLDYKRIFFFFSEIAKIPHGSGNETALADYLENFAKEKRISYVRDEADNLIFYLNATEGYEDCATLILQGHMDMVCEKENSVTHDFLTDGLTLLTDGTWLFADGTTLGGDDGIAVAYFLALMSDEEAKHPALELLVTTSEETGMEGASALDGTLLHGKYLINLDSEEEYRALCGCAGGVRVNGCVPVTREKKKGIAVTIECTGFLGGHSGTEIDKERTNAVLFLSQLLFLVRERIHFSVLEINGGRKDNAIPREACVTILLPSETAEEALSVLKQEAEVLLSELRAYEPDCSVSVCRERTEKEGLCMTFASFEKLLFLLTETPNGVQTYSKELPGMVQTSLNLGILKTDENFVTVSFLLRSSKRNELSYLKKKLRYLIEMLSGEVTESGEYPAWEFQKDSKLLSVYQKAYRSCFHKEAEIASVHAGLECGLFAQKLSGTEMISIGPDMEEIHTPKERLSISSAIRIFQLLEKILADGEIK